MSNGLTHEQLYIDYELAISGIENQVIDLVKTVLADKMRILYKLATDETKPLAERADAERRLKVLRETNSALTDCKAMCNLEADSLESVLGLAPIDSEVQS